MNRGTRVRTLALFGLAIVPVVSFAVSYLEIATAKGGLWNGYWLYGSILFVGVTSGYFFAVVSEKELPARLAGGTAYGLAIGTVYSSVFFYLILNTLGS